MAFWSNENGSGSRNDMNIGLLAIVVYGWSIIGPNPKSIPIESAAAVAVVCVE